MAQVLEPCKDSKVFKPPNPWVQSILALVAEIYAQDKLKLNLKFEIELLFRNMGIQARSLKTCRASIAMASSSAPRQTCRASCSSCCCKVPASPEGHKQAGCSILCVLEAWHVREARRARWNLSGMRCVDGIVWGRYTDLTWFLCLLADLGGRFLLRRSRTPSPAARSPRTNARSSTTPTLRRTRSLPLRPRRPRRRRPPRLLGGPRGRRRPARLRRVPPRSPRRGLPPGFPPRCRPSAPCPRRTRLQQHLSCPLLVGQCWLQFPAH